MTWTVPDGPEAVVVVVVVVEDLEVVLVVDVVEREDEEEVLDLDVVVEVVEVVEVEREDEEVDDEVVVVLPPEEPPLTMFQTWFFPPVQVHIWATFPGVVTPFVLSRHSPFPDHWMVLPVVMNCWLALPVLQV
jgi:hypothetical protein